MNRPVNYFLAVRIYNQCIHDKVASFLSGVEETNAALKTVFIPLPTLHVTLDVMSLYNEKEINNAIKSLEQSIEDIRLLTAKQENRTIEFSGMNHFGSRVLYVCLKDNSCLSYIKGLRSTLRKSFTENNVCFKDEENFTPHLTVMKLRKQDRKNGIKKIPKAVYEKDLFSYFGDEEVKDILLCSMFDEKSSDGFYKILANVNLDDFSVTRTV